MAYEVIMPKAGMSMETGTIVQWLKQTGESVEQGEPLLEIETDKVNMEVESLYAGTLLKILFEAGDVVPVTHVIAYIGEKGEAIPETVAPKASDQAQPQSIVATLSQALKEEGKVPAGNVPAGSVPATPLAKQLAAQKGIELSQIVPSGAQGEVRARDVRNLLNKKATPLAQKIAAVEGVSLTNIEGSGTAGKVYKEDVLNALQMQQTGAAKPLTGMRKVIAARMLKSHQEIPPVTMNSRADVTELAKLRGQINASLELKITFNDFVLCAVSRMFAQMGELNLSFAEGGTVRNSGIHIGFAVALQNGLIVPVIRNTDALSLRQISAAAKELSEKARAGELTMDDYSGGTFTVSNLGMYGIRSFTPIINQPETMILGVCAIEPQLVMNDAGAIEKRQMMGLSLTFDHRAMDGAQAALFLQRVAALLERPLAMLV